MCNDAVKKKSLAITFVYLYNATARTLMFECVEFDFYLICNLKHSAYYWYNFSCLDLLIRLYGMLQKMYPLPSFE